MRALLILSIAIGAIACGAQADSQPAASTGNTPAKDSGAAIAGTAPTAAGVTQLDPPTANLMRRLSALSADSMEGRLAGSPGGVRARHWIERELTGIGVAPAGASFEQPVRLKPRDGADTLGANIVARIPGKDPRAPVIVLSAHYDHLGIRNGVIYNGADDDASGCIALITIAERLKKAGLEHDVLLVFFDAEESDLVGAHAFVAAPTVPLARIAIDINLDMVSRDDGAALWVSGLSHYPFLASTVNPLVAKSSIPIKLGHDTRNLKPGDDWTESSDHGAFHDKKIPFLYLGVEDHPDYHKPGDDADKIKPQFYMGAVNFAESLLRAVDGAVHTFPAR